MKSEHVDGGDYRMEWMAVPPNGVSFNRPPGYFFLSAQPGPQGHYALVTWRKALNEYPAPPAAVVKAVERTKPRPVAKAKARKMERRNK